MENITYPIATFADKIVIYIADRLELIDPPKNCKSDLLIFNEEPLVAFCVSDHTEPRYGFSRIDLGLLASSRVLCASGRPLPSGDPTSQSLNSTKPLRRVRPPEKATLNFSRSFRTRLSKATRWSCCKMGWCLRRRRA